MNVNRFLSIALAMSIALASVSCHPQQNDPQTLPKNGKSESERPSPQSRYAITFTKFSVNKEDYNENGPSDYLFYVYNPKKHSYEYKCLNSINGCQENKRKQVLAKKGKTVHLNVKVSELATDYVHLMVLENDTKTDETIFDDGLLKFDMTGLNKLNRTYDTSHVIKQVYCPQYSEFFKKSYKKSCLKIPVQYLLDHESSCLKMATESGKDEICLYYDIEALQKLQPDFQKNLEKLSALSDLFGKKDQDLVKFFETDSRYNKGQSVPSFDFSTLSEVKNQSVSSVTFYAKDKKFKDKKFSELPTKMAQPVVDELAKKYPNGLWVIHKDAEALAAYGADQLFKTQTKSSPISISVDWPKNVSTKSINDWLKTPEKGQAYRPYHTIRLYYKKSNDSVAKPVTDLNDTVDTVSSTLTLPGRYTLGKHLDKIEVELSGIFSLLQSRVSSTSIKLTSKHGKILAELDLPDGYEDKYPKNCQKISKTVLEWFTTDKVTLQCPRLPKSLIVPDFVNGKVHVAAQYESLKLALRFKDQESQSQASLKDWRIQGKQNLSLTKEGTDGWMLVNARQLPKLGTERTLTLEPPKNGAFSLFYKNEPLSIKLSKDDWKYLYTKDRVVSKFGLDGPSVVYLKVPNPTERLVETFKDSKNPWTPEKLTFSCNSTQSNTSLCGKTCSLDSTKVPSSFGLICQGKKVDMPLKQLKGYFIRTRFLGRDWVPPVQLESKESLKNFFCGAWHLLFPVRNLLIVVGSNKDQRSIQEAQLSIPNNPKQKQNIPFYTITDDKAIWYQLLELGGNLQLDSVSGHYDYYLHQNYARKSDGEPLTLSVRPEATCKQLQSNRSQPDANRQELIPSPQPSYSPDRAPTAQIDIVAVFANNYNFQQQAVSSSISLDLGLDIPKTDQKELEAGWMRTWNKPNLQKLLRDSITLQLSKKQQRNPSVVLHYLYDDKNDHQDKWLWSPRTDSDSLKHAPVIKTRKAMGNVVDISDVVLNNDIRPHDHRRLDDQVTKIITHVTAQWQPNSDYLLVILSDSISKQEMKQLKNITLPPGNGKRSLLILTSEFLPINNDSLLFLPKLPSDTELHSVISMYDENWIKQFVKVIFDF